MTTQTTDTGLQDVVVSTSEICFIDGDRGRLLYRGFDIHDLVDRDFIPKNIEAAKIDVR